MLLRVEGLGVYFVPTLVGCDLGGKTRVYDDRRWDLLVRRACSCVRGYLMDEECLVSMAC